MFCSLPETFGRIEVMELRLLLAYPPGSAQQSRCEVHTLQRLFMVSEGDLAALSMCRCSVLSNESVGTAGCTARPMGR